MNAIRYIPHLQVGTERRPGLVTDAERHAGATTMALTACDRIVRPTLTTRQEDRVRCPECRVAMETA